MDFRIRAATWAAISNDRKLVPTWITEVATNGLADLEANERQLGADDLDFWVSACFVIGWMYPDRHPSGIREDAENKYFSSRRDDRKRSNVTILLRSGALAGQWLRRCSDGDSVKASAVTTNDDLKAIIIDHHRFKGEPEIVITSVYEFKNLSDYNSWCGDE